MEEIEKDINKLIEICELLKNNAHDPEWNLAESDEYELCRITDQEEHNWNEDNLAHYITGMQRAFHFYKKK